MNLADAAADRQVDLHRVVLVSGIDPGRAPLLQTLDVNLADAIARLGGNGNRARQQDVRLADAAVELDVVAMARRPSEIELQLADPLFDDDLAQIETSEGQLRLAGAEIGADVDRYVPAK